ncbi:hypothetical protein ES703_17401 [subsurface metagenome]
MNKEQESKAIFLPAELSGRIEERVKTTGFDSVDEYIIFVLGEVLTPFIDCSGWAIKSVVSKL